MRVIQDNLWLCADCEQIACNGAHGSGIDPAQVERSILGIARLDPTGNLVPDNDSETREGIREFSSFLCDACGTTDAGYRSRFAILGAEEVTG